jgi:SAM-dependent methyltransferase
MDNFLRNVRELVSKSGCKDALEVGCGEGRLAIHLHQQLGLSIRGTDFSQQILAQARANATEAGANIGFEVLDLSKEPTIDQQTDLVVCCEVLEHLENPEFALANIVRLARKYLVLSVPREPIWRGLNMARGKYWGDLGNTPGHIQHFSKTSFVEMISRYADVSEVRSPLPWTVVLARPRSQRAPA